MQVVALATVPDRTTVPFDVVTAEGDAVNVAIFGLATPADATPETGTSTNMATARTAGTKRSAGCGRLNFALRLFVIERPLPAVE